MIWIKLCNQNFLISILHDIVDPFFFVAALNISLQPMSLNKTNDLNILFSGHFCQFFRRRVVHCRLIVRNESTGIWKQTLVVATSDKAHNNLKFYRVTCIKRWEVLEQLFENRIHDLPPLVVLRVLGVIVFFVNVPYCSDELTADCISSFALNTWFVPHFMANIVQVLVDEL